MRRLPPGRILVNSANFFYFVVPSEWAMGLSSFFSPSEIGFAFHGINFSGFFGLSGFFGPSEIGFAFHPVRFRYGTSGINLSGLAS